MTAGDYVDKERKCNGLYIYCQSKYVINASFIQMHIICFFPINQSVNQ